MEAAVGSDGDARRNGCTGDVVCCAGIELLEESRCQRLPNMRISGQYTLQKSMDLTPLLPNAGPTGGEGEAWPAPTMSLTIWSFAIAFLAIMIVCLLYRRSGAPAIPKVPDRRCLAATS